MNHFRFVLLSFLLSLGTIAFGQTEFQQTSQNRPAPSEAQ